MADTEKLDRLNDALNGTLDALVEKRHLLLSVEVADREQADELMRWMYSKDRKPMKSTLLSIAWDKVAMDKDVAALVEQLRSAMAG